MVNDVFDIVELNQLGLACESQYIDLKVLLDDIDMKFAYRTAKLFNKAISNELRYKYFDRNDQIVKNVDRNDLIVKVGHTRKEDGSLENVILIYMHIGSKWHRYDLTMSKLISHFLSETAKDKDTIFDWYDFIKRRAFEIICVGRPSIILNDDEAIRLSNSRDSRSS